MNPTRRCVGPEIRSADSVRPETLTWMSRCVRSVVIPRRRASGLGEFVRRLDVELARLDSSQRLTSMSKRRRRPDLWKGILLSLMRRRT